MDFLLQLLPMVLLFEVPPALAIAIAAVWAHLRKPKARSCYAPSVSVSISCYAEGKDAVIAARTLVEQVYEGHIQILCIVDGALQNRETLKALYEFQRSMEHHPRRAMREVVVVPKWQRGGRVSTQNTGLYLATGEIFIACDADTAFDNDMVMHAVQPLADPMVAAVSGNLRVRNWKATVWTRLQAIEYIYSIGVTRTGLSFLNIVNNISGAFGIFRTRLLRQVGGWTSGTAEDLDLTLRLKQYFGRNKELSIAFAPDAIGYTDVPSSLHNFLLQRKRWDGDLAFLYLRKHDRSFDSSLVGKANYVAMLWLGLIHQIVLPFLILGYSCWMLLAHPELLLAVALVVYLCYTAFVLLALSLGLFLFPRHRLQDMRLLPWSLLYAPFMYCYRISSAVSLLGELLLKNHLDSNMAPYWVLKRARM